MTDEAATLTEDAAPQRAESSRRGRRGYFLPGGVALLVLLGIGAALGAGDLSHPADHTLDGSNLATQISLGIQAQQNARSVPQVSCPAREPVRVGLRFQCALRGLGSPTARTVYVTEADDRGRVTWALGPP